MGTLHRISTMIRSNLNDMISRAEDPCRMLDQVIYDMRMQLGQAQRQVAVSIADERRVRRELDMHMRAAADWERRAMLAIRAGDDELARQALARKGQHDETVNAWHAHWVAQKQGVDALRNALSGLGHKIEHAARQRRLLAARAARAHAQMSIAQTLNSMQSNSPWGTLERMEERVVQMESQAEAYAELSAGPDASLESQFAALEAGQGVEDQLAALKRQMGLPPSYAPKSLPA